ncbi:hypothetical protein FGO68_gene10141 [Halteria grandinella]|uniref:Uncharacterized protein n=1 Tax=Halteria grandinella TaxID=5974 RepID=A0A8J8NSY2_HALGN|nr:hypothetical protein FGO68_gene10141 [Halteria grandinella]
MHSFQSQKGKLLSQETLYLNNPTSLHKQLQTMKEGYLAETLLCYHKQNMRGKCGINVLRQLNKMQQH